MKPDLSDRLELFPALALAAIFSTAAVAIELIARWM